MRGTLCPEHTTPGYRGKGLACKTQKLFKADAQREEEHRDLAEASTFVLVAETAADLHLLSVPHRQTQMKAEPMDSSHNV